MNVSRVVDTEEVFYDCVSDVKYCAIASPHSNGVGHVFVNFNEARTKWKQLKGSRMKVFDDLSLAQEFANSPVKAMTLAHVYPPSPKPDVEATPFSSVSQAQLVQFRTHVEKGDSAQLQQIIEDNPLILVTSSDTPTLLQIRFRYNALHVAATSGAVAMLELILGYLSSIEFWYRIYPGTKAETVRARMLYVLDLYLNSPELGNLETPLHFASKFGHLPCVQLLAHHPIIHLDLKNRSYQTPADIAASRSKVGSKQSRGFSTLGSINPHTIPLADAIRSALDEHFILVAEVEGVNMDYETRTFILPPVTFAQLQSILVHLFSQTVVGLQNLMPFLSVEFCRMEASGVDETALDLRQYGSSGSVSALRAFAGPMTKPEATKFRTLWRKCNSTTGCKTFASVRLSDRDKGYERQGRYLARMFSTKWFEYWSFFNGFADFATEQGLSMLEKYLMTDHNLRWDIDSHNSGKKQQSPSEVDIPVENGVQESNHCSFQFNSNPFLTDGQACSTPIRRQVRKDRTIDDQWTVHRPVKPLLDDSLESCSSESERSSSSSSSAASSKKLSTSTESKLSPILNLLKRWTFSSPLRWSLGENSGTGEPFFNAESLLPSSKQPVVMANTPQKISEKRRFSVTTIDDSGTILSQSSQPPTKKTFPTNAAHVQSKQPCPIPALFRHIYRALPSSDTEMEAAISDAKIPFVAETDCSLAYESHFKSVNLSNFHMVATWKEHLDHAINLTDTHW